MNRRKFMLSSAALCLLGYGGYRYYPEQGFTNPCLTQMPDALKNHPLMAQIWTGIKPEKVWDTHVHLVGVGDTKDKKSPALPWSSPNLDSNEHPVLKLQKYFYMNGTCSVAGDVDRTSVSRLLAQIRQMPAGFKAMLFAFDWYHNEDGSINQAYSIFHIPNSYAQHLAHQYSEAFEWVASIHPYRKDAVSALKQAVENGARAIKWLPQGMGIDPSSPKCDAFYAALAEYHLPIICHTGHESAVQGGHQAFANPLKLRRALDAGVRVVLAHCASDGEDEGLDTLSKHKVKSFVLFSRLMDDPKYKGLVFGDISALTLFNHAWALKPILQNTAWHSRLLNGSDYPLPGILPLISLKKLVRDGLLEEAHTEFLEVLRNHNALLFDFALKRLIRWNGVSFPRQTFETSAFFAK